MAPWRMAWGGGGSEGDASIISLRNHLVVLHSNYCEVVNADYKKVEQGMNGFIDKTTKVLPTIYLLNRATDTFLTI